MIRSILGIALAALIGLAVTIVFAPSPTEGTFPAECNKAGNVALFGRC